MKKFVFALCFMTMSSFMACGNSTANGGANDTDSVAVDSIDTVVVDSVDSVVADTIVVK